MKRPSCIASKPDRAQLRAETTLVVEASLNVCIVWQPQQIKQTVASAMVPSEMVALGVVTLRK